MTALWEECLRSLMHELPTQQYNTWIRPLIASSRNQQLILSAPNRFVRDWVKDKYLQRIQEILSDLNGGRITHVDLVVGESQPMFRPPEPARQPVAAVAPAPANSFAATRVREEDDLPVDEEPEAAPAIIIPSAPLPAAAAKASGRREVQVEGGLKHRSFLNPAFTFKTFVEGKSNQLAHAAARQVAENAGGS